MQTFLDSSTAKVWEFEDGIGISVQNGAYVFTTPMGISLNVPLPTQPAYPPGT